MPQKSSGASLRIIERENKTQVGEQTREGSPPRATNIHERVIDEYSCSCFDHVTRRRVKQKGC